MGSKNIKLIIAAVLITFFNIGVFFTFDIKQFLADRYLHYFDITPQEIEHIESNICLTSTIISVFMGVFIKWTSPSTVCVLSNLFLFLITIGVFVGVDTVNFNAILFLAYLRGVFIEGIFLAQATLTVDLFTGQILSLMMGLPEVANALTTAISSFLIPKIFVWFRNIPFCFFLGSIVAGVGTILTMIWWFLEIRGWGKEITLSEKEDEKEEDGTKEQEGKDNAEDGAVGEKKDSAYSNLWDFNIWLNCFNFALGTSSMVIFNTFGNELFVRRFGCDIQRAGLIMSLIPLLTIPFTPTYSWISMKYGKKTPIIIFGYAAAALAFIYISLLPKKLSSLWQLAVPIFLYAQFQSICHAFLYTNIGLVASTRIVSVAFGISSLLFGVIYFIETNLLGIFLKPDTSDVYQMSLIIIALLHVAGFLVSLVVFSIDMKRGKVLYLPENSDEVMELKKKIDKGYKWFKENYLKGKGPNHGESQLRAPSSTNYTLNNRLLSEQREDGRDEDRTNNSAGRRTLMTVSDQKEAGQDVADKESLN